MSDNFDLRKYLVENKVTTNSKLLDEASVTPGGELEDFEFDDMSSDEEEWAVPGGVAEYLDTIPLEHIETAPDIFGEVLIDLFTEEDPSFRVPSGLALDTWDDQLIDTAGAYKEQKIDKATAIKMLRKILLNPKNYKR